MDFAKGRTIGEWRQAALTAGWGQVGDNSSAMNDCASHSDIENRQNDAQVFMSMEEEWVRSGQKCNRERMPLNPFNLGDRGATAEKADRAVDVRFSRLCGWRLHRPRRTRHHHSAS